MCFAVHLGLFALSVGEPRLLPRFEVVLVALSLRAQQQSKLTSNGLVSQLPNMILKRQNLYLPRPTLSASQVDWIFFQLEGANIHITVPHQGGCAAQQIAFVCRGSVSVSIFPQ